MLGEEPTHSARDSVRSSEQEEARPPPSHAPSLVASWGAGRLPSPGSWKPALGPRPLSGQQSGILSRASPTPAGRPSSSSTSAVVALRSLGWDPRPPGLVAGGSEACRPGSASREDT